MVAVVGRCYTAATHREVVDRLISAREGGHLWAQAYVKGSDHLMVPAAGGRLLGRTDPAGWCRANLGRARLHVVLGGVVNGDAVCGGGIRMGAHRPLW